MILTTDTPMETCGLCLGMGVRYYHPQRKINGTWQQVTRSRPCSRCGGASIVPVGSRNP